MHRRNILWGVLSAIGGALGASRAQATAGAKADGKLKVVYHLNDLDKVNFVLGNIQNHFDGVGGPDFVTIALVVHGQALKEMAACGKTMKSQNVTMKELLPGFVAAEQGGVVRIAELQSQGYLYLRP